MANWVTLLNIETFGIRLFKIDDSHYELQMDDVSEPITHTAYYETRTEAISDAVRYIVNPDNVYSMDEIPEDLRKAFEMVGVPSEVAPLEFHPAMTFLYYVLDGIAHAKEFGRDEI